MEEKKQSSTAEEVLGFILSIPAGIYHAFVFSVLWQWFIATIFNLPIIGVAEAYALLLVVGFLKFTIGIKQDEISNMKRVVVSVVFSSVAWGMGAIINQFI